MLGAEALRPGEQVSGTVRIGNDGALAGDLVLRPGALSDTAGPGGGRVSDALAAQHRRRHGPRPARDALRRPAGRLHPARGRKGRCGGSARVPVRGDVRDAPGRRQPLPGIRAQPRARVGATAVPPAATPTPTRSCHAAPRSHGARRPAAPAPAAAFADLLGLPRAGTCVRAGTLRFKLRAPYGGRVLSASVAVNRKTKVKGRKALAAITLGKLPKRTTVAVTSRPPTARPTRRRAPTPPARAAHRRG